MKLLIESLWRDGLQTRVSLDEQTVSEYAEAMRDGEEFPPVKVYEEPCAGAYYLADGFHRVEAAMRAGYKELEADVVRGTFEDALRYALSCNSRHGKRLTNEDKRRALSIAWEHRFSLFGGHPSASLLATTCGVHRNTAQAFIAEQLPSPKPEQVAQIVQPAAPKMPTRQVVGTDGKVYTARPAPMPTRPKRQADAPDEKPAHIVPVDRYGVEIPVPIQDAFGEDVLALILHSISNARAALRHGREEKDMRFAAVRQDADIMLNNAYNFIAAAEPWCVCRMCQGQGCKACHGRGWQTEEEYKRNPEEFKAKAAR